MHLTGVKMTCCTRLETNIRNAKRKCECTEKWMAMGAQCRNWDGKMLILSQRLGQPHAQHEIRTPWKPELFILICMVGSEHSI